VTWLRLTDISLRRMRRVNSDHISDYAPMDSGGGAIIWLSGTDLGEVRRLSVEESAEVIDDMIAGRPTGVA